MKKLLFLALMACLAAGCKDSGGSKDKEEVEEPESSVAKDATWDLFLIGSWRYADTGGKKTEYAEGIENFHANGDYECYTQDKKGRKVVINGTWKLDDDDDFVVWVTQKSIKNAEGTISNDEEEVKYIILSLAPEETLNYQAGKTTRTAEWIGE